MKKLIFLIGGVLGYVLGARAGRERYEQIVDAGQSVWENPRVQEGRSKVQETVSAQVPVLKEKAAEVATEAKNVASEKVTEAKHVASEKASEAKHAAKEKVAEARDNSETQGPDKGMGQKKPHLPEPPKA